jgi:hypothetical protein
MVGEEFMEDEKTQEEGKPAILKAIDIILENCM